MNRLPLSTNVVGEGLSWLVVSAPYDEALVAEEEARFSAECKRNSFIQIPPSKRLESIEKTQKKTRT